MRLNTFEVIKEAKIDLSNVNLSVLPCGLFRCSLDEAEHYLPELKELYDSLPVEDKSEWEIDVKIHMLMKNQYPCIPNWHCDNVPHVDGKTRYDLIDDTLPKMLLWVSDHPTTEFLKFGCNVEKTIGDHAELYPLINQYEMETVKIPSMTWISMDQRTPHRGTCKKCGMATYQGTGLCPDCDMVVVGRINILAEVLAWIFIMLIAGTVLWIL